MPTYAFPSNSMAYDPPALPAVPQPLMQPTMLDAMQNPSNRAPVWDDININNINNIIGDIQPTTNVVPDFDFVSIVI